MKAKILLFILVIQLSACFQPLLRPATYLDSKQQLLAQQPGCSKGEIHSFGHSKEQGHIVMQRCLNNLVEDNGRPLNVEVGEKEIVQCLKDEGFEILVECHPSYD